MTWFGWVWIALAAISCVVGIGKAKTPAEAAGIVLANVLLVWGAATIGTN